MKNVSRKKMIREVALAAGITKKRANEITTIFFDFVEKMTLVEGRRVELKGFGTFRPHTQNRRDYTAPRTGEKMEITPRRTIKFKFSETKRREGRKDVSL